MSTTPPKMTDAVLLYRQPRELSRSVPVGHDKPHPCQSYCQTSTKLDKKHGILDNNQSAFRPGRSTAVATQVIIRIQEDMQYIRPRHTATNSTEDENEPEGRLLHLEKAYPRVSKPALWQILERLGLKGLFFYTIKDLHEATSYAVKSREGDSANWLPQRGLRDGCPNSPPSSSTSFTKW